MRLILPLAWVYFKNRTWSIHVEHPITIEIVIIVYRLTTLGTSLYHIPVFYFNLLLFLTISHFPPTKGCTVFASQKMKYLLTSLAISIILACCPIHTFLMLISGSFYTFESSYIVIFYSGTKRCNVIMLKHLRVFNLRRQPW